MSETKQAPEPQNINDIPPAWLSKQQLKKWNKKMKYIKKQANKDTNNASINTSSNNSSSQLRKKKKHQKNIRKHVPQYDDPNLKKKMKKHQIQKRQEIRRDKRIGMFEHLPQFECNLYNIQSIKIKNNINNIHPNIIHLGYYYNNGHFRGANARCIAMLNAFKVFINDMNVPNDKRFSQVLLSQLNPAIRYLSECRPISMSMGNAIRFLKAKIRNIDNESDKNKDQQNMILKSIDEFIQMKIETADFGIIKTMLDKKRIKNGDCILTYGLSSVVQQLIVVAYEKNIKFKVIIIDNGPLYEGKILLENLCKYCENLEITYGLLNSLSYIMDSNEINSVILGCSSIFNNGTCVSRVGTGMVTLLAKNYKIPVVILCETYKFSERVQIDSICYNEIANFDGLINNNKQTILKNWRNINGLKMLNIRYDLTPSEFISIVVTEIGEIPPTSAPVIIREYHRHRELQ